MWFAYIEGKQHPLGISDPGDVAGADAAHKNLIEQLAASIAAKLGGEEKSRPPALTVSDAVAAYLTAAERRVAVGRIKIESLANYRLSLGHLTATFGHRALSSLTAIEIEEWAERPGWSVSYQNSTLGTVQQLLKASGISLPIHRPPKESRGASTILTEEQFATVLDALQKRSDRGDLPELLCVLRETGARPQEIAQLHADGIDWDNASARITRHKTRRHTGADRVVYFNSAAMVLLRKQREKWPAGLLFRTRSGNSYRATVIVRRLWEISERVGFRVIAYGLRHGFATRKLEAGVSDVLVAGLLGHRGTAMLHAHYSHVTANSRLMKEAAEK